MNTTTEAINLLNKEEERLLNELQTIKLVREKLTTLTGQVRTSPPKPNGKLAPRGHIDQAIEHALGASPLGPKEIEEKLLKNGYAYPLRNSYIVKALTRLKKAKRAKNIGYGQWVKP